MQVTTLGVDIGGVIISGPHSQSDTSFFDEDYLATPPILRSFEYLRKLNQDRFARRIHLVSKCTISIQEKSMNWLRHNNFFELTGILPENAHFCRNRVDKSTICNQFNITHFVDDRSDVLNILDDKIYKVLFVPDLDKLAEYNSGVVPFNIAQNWEEVYTHLINSS